VNGWREKKGSGLAHLFIRAPHELVLVSNGSTEFVDCSHILGPRLPPLEARVHGAQLFGGVVELVL
jgi:hypothetical protein